MTAIAVSRRFGGIGDWLMALHCARLVNRQRPDVAVHVSFDTPEEPLPAFVPEAWEKSGVRYTLEPPPADARHTGHLVYKRDGLGFMPSMLAALNARCGLAIEFDEDWPRFGLEARLSRKASYVCMIGHGKRIRQGGKDPGHGYFNQLSRLLGEHVRVVQLGAVDDEPLAGAQSDLRGAPFCTVARCLFDAGGFVGIENGLMILAGFLGAPQITLYNGRGFPARVAFANQVKVPQPNTPEETCRLALSAF